MTENKRLKTQLEDVDIQAFALHFAEYADEVKDFANYLCTLKAEASNTDNPEYYRTFWNFLARLYNDVRD